MTSTSKKVGGFTLIGCALLLVASGCNGTDAEARARLDSLEMWADSMKFRAEQNLQWAYDQIHELSDRICTLEGDDCDPVDPPLPPDSIPTLIH
jgi:hypothetical protein